jgi:hypothetical protein
MFYIFVRDMKIIATYKEISSYIKKNYNINIELNYISDNKVTASGSIAGGLVSGNITVKVIEQRKSSIDISYSTTSIAIKLALLKLSIQGIDNLGDNKLAIRFGQMNGLKEIFKTLQLNNFEFLEEGVKIELIER